MQTRSALHKSTAAHTESSQQWLQTEELLQHVNNPAPPESSSLRVLPSKLQVETILRGSSRLSRMKFDHFHNDLPIVALKRQLFSPCLTLENTSKLPIAEFPSINIPVFRDRTLITYITLDSPRRAPARERSLRRIRAYITRLSNCIFICRNPLTVTVRGVVGLL